MPYKALEIAKYIITYCQVNDFRISNLKLQKLLYYTWIGFYKVTEKALFDDEICAWQFGPVVPEVYYEFCSYAGISISLPYECNADLSEYEKGILDNTLSEFANLSASVLVERTHSKGKPWDVIYENGAGNRSVIPFALIIEKECKG